MGFFLDFGCQFQDKGKDQGEEARAPTERGEAKTNLGSGIVTSRTTPGSALINCLRHT